MFIVFEWVDWSWKDTQLEKVLSYLRQKDKNIQIWLTKEPTKNTVAWKMILENRGIECYLIQLRRFPLQKVKAGLP